nr:MAG TPA: hypothetical protein [Caudoviricetes sp.]
MVREKIMVFYEEERSKERLYDKSSSYLFAR